MARTRNAAAPADAFTAGDLQELEEGRMILRCTQRERYVVLLQATVRDRSLSFKARGILAFLLSHPDNWKPNIKHIENSSNKDGRDSIAAGIRELIAGGYARRVTTRDAKGRIESKELQISETPMFGQLKPVAKPVTTPQTDFPVEAASPEVKPETAFPFQGIDDPETAIPFEADEPLETGFPYQAEPRTDYPETAFPDMDNPHLRTTDNKNSEFTKSVVQETPPAPPAAAATPTSTQPTSAAAGAEQLQTQKPKGATKASTEAGWSPAGVGEWLTSFRQATPQEVDFVLGELAKKSPQEIKNPNAYADSCLRSLRASEAQRRETETLLAQTDGPSGDICVHGANNGACPQCRPDAQEAKARIREMVAALAAQKSA